MTEVFSPEEKATSFYEEHTRREKEIADIKRGMAADALRAAQQGTTSSPEVQRDRRWYEQALSARKYRSHLAVDAGRRQLRDDGDTLYDLAVEEAKKADVVIKVDESVETELPADSRHES